MPENINDIINDELLSPEVESDDAEKLDLGEKEDDVDDSEEVKSKGDDDKESDESDAESEDKDDEEKETKLEIKDEDDELELTNIPRRAELKAAYPDIFKKFPALDHVIQREKQYSDIFPSLSEARTVKEDVDRLKGFESELLSGDLEGTLKSVKAADEDSFNKMTDHYIATLYKVDKAAHLKLTNNIFKGVLKAVSDNYKDAEKDSNEEQFLIAAKVLHKALYGSTNITGPEVISKETKEDPEKAKLQNERKIFEQTKLQDAVQSVVSTVYNSIERAVTDGIDPKGILPPYLRETLIRDVLSTLNKDMKGDRRFKDFIDRKWLDAQKSGYNDDSKKAIRKALLLKAKSLLPSIMRSKKAAALKGLVTRKRVNDDDEDVESQIGEKKEREPRSEEGKKKPTFNRQDGDRLKPKPGESNRAFFMRD